MEFQESRGTLEMALLLVAALGLDFAELVHGLLKLAGEPCVVQAENGEGAVGVDNVKVDASLIGGWVGGAIQEGGFERGDAIEAPGGVSDLLSELGLGGCSGLILLEEAAAMRVVSCLIFGGQDGGRSR